MLRSKCCFLFVLCSLRINTPSIVLKYSHNSHGGRSWVIEKNGVRGIFSDRERNDKRTHKNREREGEGVWEWTEQCFRFHLCRQCVSLQRSASLGGAPSLCSTQLHCFQRMTALGVGSFPRVCPASTWSPASQFQCITLSCHSQLVPSSVQTPPALPSSSSLLLPPLIRRIIHVWNQSTIPTNSSILVRQDERIELKTFLWCSEVKLQMILLVPSG